MRLSFLFLLLFFLSGVQISAQKNAIVIAFWNVENLFDTIDDPAKQDEEFTPQGKLAWTGERYRRKLSVLADVISRIGKETNDDGAAIIGLCEVENKAVLEDLVRQPQIKKRKYKAVLLEGPDIRGIDPALLYNPSYFKLEETAALRVQLPDTSIRTRDVLCVYGSLGGEPVAVFVNHWPSRRGGEKASRPSRIAAARVVKKAADSLMRSEPHRRIILAGDFNDDPTSYSVREVICSSDKKENVSEGCFFNPMAPLFRKGIGTLAWNDRWNLFDQVMFSTHWLGQKGWVFSDAGVFNKPLLTGQEGNFKGYPFRTYSAGVYTGGYSDHFPSYAIIKNIGEK